MHPWYDIGYILIINASNGFNSTKTAVDRSELAECCTGIERKDKKKLYTIIRKLNDNKQANTHTRKQAHKLSVYAVVVAVVLY